MFQLILSWAPQMNFDMFASHLNNKFPRFASISVAPGCSTIDAFSVDWNSCVPYCFPPRNQYLRSMEYIRVTGVKESHFIIPLERTAMWYPVMLKLLVGKIK